MFRNKVVIGGIAIALSVSVIACSESAPTEEDTEVTAGPPTVEAVLPASTVEAVAPAPVVTPPALSRAQEQAIGSAADYLELVGGFSRQGLIDQLKFEGFTVAEAEFAVDYLSPDWNAQAVQSAESYLNVGGFSRQGLIDQLLFEGFMLEQAEYAVSAVGF